MSDLWATVAASLDTGGLLTRVAEQVCGCIDAADTAAVTLRDGDGDLLTVAASGRFDVFVGRRVRLEETFAGAAMTRGEPALCGDALADPVLTEAQREPAAALGIRTVLAVPLCRSGETIGVISIGAEAPHAFSRGDVAALQALNGYLAAAIASGVELSALVDELRHSGGTAPTPGATRLLASLIDPSLIGIHRTHREIDAVIDDDALRPVFQPIRRVSDRGLAAVECLSRLPPGRSTEEWFGAAHAVGRGTELELYALGRGLRAAAELPRRTVLYVNLSPSVLLGGAAEQLLLGQDRPIVVELTEHEPDGEALGQAVGPLRDAGIRIAVDDAGSGFAGLKRILNLRPDVLKLDRDLTAGIDHDPVRQSLAAAVVGFANSVRVQTVAEGVETEAELTTIARLGFTHAQGHLLGRPVPAAQVSPAGPASPPP